VSHELQQFYDKCWFLHDLTEAQQVLEWDQQVMMPNRGSEQRSRQLAALAEVAHLRLIDPALSDLIRDLSDRSDLEPDALADVREARRAHERAVKVPASLVAERARVCSLAQMAWVEARRADDFAAFLPHLREVLRLTREMAVAINSASPYDALLDEFEPGMTEAELSSLFSTLRDRLVPLLDQIRGAEHKPSRAVLHRRFPREGQEVFCRRVMGEMGYDLEAGRLDVSAHPFTSGTFGDVRITTRYDEHFLSSSLFGVIHEAGHGIYEQGLDPLRYRSPAGQACSLGVHESQSRFWENLIGRSRAFWSHYFPILQQTFAGTLEDVSLEEFYRAINVCEPSLIRVEADEVTYNLHIILRFELESALLKGQLEAGDLPQAWREKTQRLLGLTPPSDREGVLQDVHWSAGLIGYFPTYTLGNLYAAQFLAQLEKDVPDVLTQVARGQLRPIKQWLNHKVHVHGRRYLAADLCRQVTSAPLAVDPALEYLARKYGEIYGR
jgi:carboxypeptidase Taq